MAVPGFVVSGLFNIGIGLLAQLLYRSSLPDQVVEGPRLSDLSVTSSAYGAAINVADGTIRLSGNVIWSPGIEEEVIVTEEEIGGKGGGPTLTTIQYRYFLSWAIGFAAADDVTQGEALLRVWADGKIIYDATGTGKITTHTTRFYSGSEDQQPDPIIVADVDGRLGAGSTLAYRGLCYVVFERMALADFGNRPPIITAEITFNATQVYPRDDLVELAVFGTLGGGDYIWYYDPCTNYMIAAVEGDLAVVDDTSFVHLDTTTRTGANFPGDEGSLCLTSDCHAVSGGGPTDDIQKLNLNTLTVVDTMNDTPEYLSLGQWSDLTLPIRLTTGELVEEMAVFGGLGGQVAILGAKNMVAQVDDVDLWETVSGGDLALTPEAVNNTPFTDPEHQCIYLLSNWTTAATDPDKQVLWRFRWNGEWAEEGYGDTHGAQYDGGQFGTIVEEVARYSKTELFGASLSYGGACLLLSENAVILSTGAHNIGSANAKLVKIDLTTGNIVAGPVASTYGSFRGFQHKVRGNKFAYATTGGIVEISTTDLSLIRIHDAVDDMGLTEAANAAFDTSFWYDEDRDAVIVDRRFIGGPSDAPARTRIYLGRLNGVGTPLDQVVRRYAKRTGRYVDADFTLSEISGYVVEGNALTRTSTTGRQGLEPLLQAYFFDLVEDDWLLAARVRGRSSVGSVPENHIGKRRSTDDLEPVKETRIQEVELPEKVEIAHSDRNQDYQENVEFDKRVSLPNPTMSSRDVVRIDLGPLVLSPTDAKRLAQRWLYTTWEQRVNLDFSLPWRYIRFSPADVFDITVDGEVRRVRLEKVEVGARLPLTMNVVQEDESTAVSTVQAGTSDSHHGTVVVPAVPTKAILLDAPILLAIDDTGGTSLRGYAAMSGFGEAAWPGAVLVRSTDDGASWQAVGSAAAPAAWGYVQTAPTDWDGAEHNRFQSAAEGGIVRVAMRDRGGDLSSATEAAVMASGVNRAALVAPTGEVEIFAFTTVTNVEADTYDLSNLLRGRRGTEDVSDGAVIAPGSLFVLLEPSPVLAFTTLLADRNRALRYRAVTRGQALADAHEVFHTDTGRDRRPYAPVHLDVLATEQQGLVATWVRRTRFNGEWVDGTGTVPLNETTEEYTAVLDTGATRTTKVVTSPTATFSKAEVEVDGAGTTGSAHLLDDFGMVPTSNGWTAIGAGSSAASASVGNISAPPGASGNGTFGHRTGATNGVRFGWHKTFDLAADTTFGSSTGWASNAASLEVQCWIAADVVTEGRADVTVNVLDQYGAVIDTHTTGLIDLVVNGTWEQHSVVCPLPRRAHSYQVELAFTNVGGATADFGFDVLETVTYQPPADIVLEVTQNSGVPGVTGITATKEIT